MSLFLSKLPLATVRTYVGVLLLSLSSYSLAESPLHILSLGDSYTIGTSVTPADRWPNLLQEQLESDGIKVATPEIIARNGWTTSALLNKLDHGTIRKHYDWVTLLIGVNNQFQGRSITQFEDELNQLIDHSIKLANGKSERVLVLTIPDWSLSLMGQRMTQGMDADLVSKDIERFNKVLIEQVESASAQLVDIRHLVNSSKGDPSQFASDGLHFSRKSHSAWAAKAAALIGSISRK